MVELPTGIVTFLFTDIEGSTVLRENYSSQMRAALERHDEIFRSNVEAKGGYVFATGDDAFSVAFDSPSEALEAVLAIQRALFTEKWPENVEVPVRMGLHSGRAEERDGGFFGAQVDRPARLMGAGHGGQVLLSNATYNLVRDELANLEPGAELRYLGEHRLKGLRHTERIFQLIVPDLPANFPPLNTDGLVDELVNLDRRYRRVRYLDGGGHGDVYLVRHEALDKDMALKVMKDDFAKDDQFVKLFKREARTLANLSHPNIVAVNDAGEGIFEGQKVPYMAMEYVSGGTLSDLITQKGLLAPHAAVEHAIRVAEALEAAHNGGLIHRDIKSKNILLTEAREAKVADFGIARAVAAATVAASSSGLRLGTPHYISPEQAKGDPATFQSDLYSLGVVFYEMLTGKLPYDAESAWGILSKHIRGQLRPPKEVNQNVPEGIDQVCVRLLARDPDDRYRDASALIAVLKAVKDNPHAVMDDKGPTVRLGRVRDDTGSTMPLGRVRGDTLRMPAEVPDLTGQTLSWVERLAELYAQAHQLLTGQTLSWANRPAKLYMETSITASNAGRIQLLRTLEGHTGKVNSVAFSPDGWLLASGAVGESTVWLWGVKDGELLRTLEGHENWVNSVAFSPNGRLLASGAGGKTVRLWGVEDGELLRTLEVYTDVAVNSVAFSSDERLLALGAVGTMARLWRVAEDRILLRTLEGHTGKVNSVAFSPDGRLLALGSEGNTVSLWGVEDGELLRTLEGHTGKVNSVAFSPDGQLLASGASDNRVQLWRVEDGELLRTIRGEGHKGPVNSVAFSPDGRLLTSGSADKTVQLWRVEDGALLRTLGGYMDSAVSVAFSPGGRRLASDPDDKTGWLWQVDDGALLRTFEGHTDSVNSVAFSPDGRLLASGSQDKTVRLWGIA